MFYISQITCINVLQNLTQRLQPWPVLVILFNFFIIEQDVVFDILTDWLRFVRIRKVDGMESFLLLHYMPGTV